MIGEVCSHRSPRGDRESFQREGNALFDDFCRAFGHSKAREEKSFFMFLCGRTMFAPTTQSQSPLNSQNKRFMPIRFFFCICRRKRKSYQKENAEIRFRALRSTTTAVGGRHRLLKKAGENFIESKQKYYCKRKSGRKKSDGCPPLFIILFFHPFSLSAVLPFHRKQTVYFRPMQLPLRLFSAGLSSAFPRRGACRF